MGKQVKTLAVTAAIAVAAYYTGGLANIYFGSAAAGYAASAAVLIAGQAIAGSALSPDLPDSQTADQVDSYAGQKLQTTKNNTSAVPLVFGENRIGSNIIYQETNEAVAGATNKDYWSIQIISEGEINSYEELYANEDTMVDKGSDVHTLKYVHCKVYATSGVSGIALNSVSFATTQAGATQTGSALGLTNFTIPANVAFIAVHQVYDATSHTGLDSITAKIQGIKVPQINATTLGSDIYTSNFAECVLYVMQDGLNIPTSEIDIPSFYNAKTKANTYGYSVNVSFREQRNIQSIIKDMLATSRGQIVYSQGKWKLKLDEKQQSIAKALDEDDILNKTLSISMKGFSEIANTVELKYVNPTDQWLPAKVTVDDSDLITNDGQTLITVLDTKGVTVTAQADKLAEITLNTMRYTESALGARIKQTPIVIAFSTTVKNEELEVGDVISIDHSLFDRVRKFMILSIELDQSGAIKLSCREYCETHFKDSGGSYLI